MLALTLTMAALATAAAIAPRTSTTDACKEEHFTLVMAIGDVEYSVNAAGNSSDLLYAVAMPKETYHGTPIIKKGNDTNAQLIYSLHGDNHPLTDYADGLYALDVGDIGDVEGSYTAVMGVAYTADSYDGFQVERRQIFNEMTDADQHWVACDTTIDGSPFTVLGWGLQFPNGSWPTGCTPTEVRKRFNVDCS